MKLVQRIGLLFGLFFLASAAACLPIQTSSPGQTLDSGTIYTQAAQTVVAQITSAAQADMLQKTQAAATEASQVDLAVQTIAARLTSEAQFAPTPSAPEVVFLTATSAPTAYFITPTPLPADCDRASFLGELSAGSDIYFYPGEIFRLTWRLRNVGSCTWTPDYRLEMTVGDFQGGTSILLQNYVQPGKSIDISVPLIAPQQSGTYAGLWNMKNTAGQYFGVGPDGNSPLSFQAIVLASPVTYSYDFAANYCAAEWRTGAGMLSCLGIDDEKRGLVRLADYAILENGVEDGPALWTLPNHSNSGWISGRYPPLLIKRGDRFRAKLGCLVDNADCDVTFQVEYELVNGTVQTLGLWRETFDGRTTTINQDLSPLAGQSVKFIFTVTVQNNYPADAIGVWVFARVEP